MNIQQNFNALLTMGAVAARSSDKYQQNAAIRKELKYNQAINERVNHSAKLFDKEGFEQDPGPYENDLKEQVKDVEKRVESDKRLAELDPSKENFNEINQSLDYLDLVKERYNKAVQANVEEALAKEKAEEQAKFAQEDAIGTVYNTRNGMEEREAILKQKQDNMRDVLAAARKTYGGK